MLDSIHDFMAQPAYAVGLYALGAGVGIIWLALRLLRYWTVQHDKPILLKALEDLFLGLALGLSAIIVGEHPKYDREMLLPWVRFAFTGYIATRYLSAHLEGLLLHRIRQHRRRLEQAPEIRDITEWAESIRDKKGV